MTIRQTSRPDIPRGDGAICQTRDADVRLRDSSSGTAAGGQRGREGDPPRTSPATIILRTPRHIAKRAPALAASVNLAHIRNLTRRRGTSSSSYLVVIDPSASSRVSSVLGVLTRISYRRTVVRSVSAGMRCDAMPGHWVARGHDTATPLQSNCQETIQIELSGQKPAHLYSAALLRA